jgi:uncharacterized phage protein (TIGR02218 family)
VAYDSIETSTYNGSDSRLYRFQLGNKVWLYTNADSNILYGTDNYLAIAINDEGLKQKSEVITDAFNINVVSSIPLVTLFNGTAPSMQISVQVRQIQQGDTEAPLMWVGYLSSVKYKDDISSTLVCNTNTAYLNRQGVRLSYTRACPHALYDQDCQLNMNDWVETITIRDLGGNGFNFDVVTPGPQTYDGRFTNGFIQWNPDPDYTERRAILVHNGQQIILLNQTDGLANGMTVMAYPGCQRVPNNCHLFNNIANYGGFPFMPGKSPFDGDPVF